MLQADTTVTLTPGARSCVVRRMIGEGSQGSVFEVSIEGAPPQALKWYLPGRLAGTQLAAITELVERGSPDPRLLWPEEVVRVEGEPTFGYLMPLRPDSYVGLSDLLTGRVSVPVSRILSLGIGLSSCFLSLHSQGLCYRDISFGNVFFDPASGDPLICDTDNVGIDGVSASAVLGTRKFMAPEIVRREAPPSTATDLFSLSVLLFYLLMVGHPLLGRRELQYEPLTDKAESILFGTDPLFVFHPDDDSNAPDVEEHAAVLTNWEFYPEYVRELFVTAFTEGLEDPVNGRVRESVWRSTLARARDDVVVCSACQREQFAGVDPVTCWNCRREVVASLRLRFPARTLVLNPGTVVARHHLAGDYDYVEEVGRVAAHPTDPAKWGLRNVGSSTWKVTLPGGDELEVPPDRAVGLVIGATIEIDGVTAELVA